MRESTTDDLSAILRRLNYLRLYRDYPIGDVYLRGFSGRSHDDHIQYLTMNYLSHLFTYQEDYHELLDIIFELHTIKDKQEPSHDSFKHLLQILRAICHEWAKSSTLTLDNANTGAQQQTLTRLFMQLLSLFNPDDDAMLSHDLQLLKQQLLAHDPNGFAGLYQLFFNIKLQLLQLNKASTAQVEKVIAVINFMQEKIDTYIYVKNILNLDASKLQEARSCAAGLVAKQAAIPLIDVILRNQTHSENILITRFNRLFARDQLFGPFKRFSPVKVEHIHHALLSMTSLNDVVEYCTKLSPTAITDCINPDVKQALAQFHIACIKVITDSYATPIPYALSHHQITELISQTHQLHQHFSADNSYAEPLALNIIELERIIKQHFKELPPSAQVTVTEAASSKVILQKLAQQPKPSVHDALAENNNTEKQLSAIGELDNELQQHINSHPPLHQFYHMLHNYFENKIIGHKAVQSGKVSAHVSPVPENVEGIIHTVFKTVESISGNEIPYTTAAAITAIGRFVAEEYMQIKLEDSAKRVTEKLSDMAYLSILTKAISVKLTQILEKQLEILDEQGLATLANVVTDRIERFLSHCKIDPTRSIIDQALEFVLTDDTKHCLGPGLTSVTTPHDKRGLFTTYRAESLLTSSPIVMVDADGKLHYFAGPGFDLSLPPRRVSVELAERLIMNQHMLEVDAEQLVVPSQAWRAQAELLGYATTVWHTSTVKSADLLTLPDHGHLLHDYMDQLYQKHEQLALAQEKTAAVVAQQAEQIEAQRVMIDSLHEQMGELRAIIPALLQLTEVKDKLCKTLDEERHQLTDLLQAEKAKHPEAAKVMAKSEARTKSHREAQSVNHAYPVDMVDVILAKLAEQDSQSAKLRSLSEALAARLTDENRDNMAPRIGSPRKS